MSTWHFVTRTGDGDCGGTNADVYLILEGTRGVSPESGYWWVLDNDGDDMERGDYDFYKIDTDSEHGGGSIGFVHTIHLYFQMKQTNDEWDLTEAWLQETYDNVINSWKIYECLRENGWHRWTHNSVVGAIPRFPVEDFGITTSAGKTPDKPQYLKLVKPLIPQSMIDGPNGFRLLFPISGK